MQINKKDKKEKDFFLLSLALLGQPASQLEESIRTANGTNTQVSWQASKLLSSLLLLSLFRCWHSFLATATAAVVVLIGGGGGGNLVMPQVLLFQ